MASSSLHDCGKSTFVQAYLMHGKVIELLDDQHRKKLANENKEECPICLQGYGRSTVTTSVSCSCGHSPIKIIECGHIIHVGCYITLVMAKKFACPRCTVVPHQFVKTIDTSLSAPSS